MYTISTFSLKESKKFGKKKEKKGSTSRLSSINIDHIGSICTLYTLRCKKFETP